MFNGDIMNNITHLKGFIESINDDTICVFSKKDNCRYLFKITDIPNSKTFDKVDLLIIPAKPGEELSRILSAKPSKKPKPIKIANFSTLLKHMIITKERLIATQEEEQNSESTEQIQEKIDWLTKGISLFS